MATMGAMRFVVHRARARNADGVLAATDAARLLMLGEEVAQAAE